MKEKNNAIQGLRGALCLMVFLGHFQGMYGSRFLTSIYNHTHIGFFDGSISVVCFFVLSGYYIEKTFEEETSYLYFVLKRIMRLMIPFWGSCILGLMMRYLCGGVDNNYLGDFANSFWNSPCSANDIVKYFVLIGDYNLINPPSWTIRIEFNMLIFFGIIVWGLSRLSNFFECKICNCIQQLACVVSFMVIACISVFFYSIHAPIVNYYILPVFCFGAVSRIIVKNLEINDIKICKIIELFLCVLSVILLNNKHFLGVITGMITDYVISVGMVFLILLCERAVFIKRLLSSDIMRCMGDYSFSFYLVHFLVLLSLRRVGYLNGFIILLIALLGSIVLAFFLEKISRKIYSFLLVLINRGDK